MRTCLPGRPSGGCPLISIPVSSGLSVGVPRRRPSCQTSRAALSTQSSVVTRHSDGSGERKSGVTFALPQTMTNTADAQVPIPWIHGMIGGL